MGNKLMKTKTMKIMTMVTMAIMAVVMLAGCGNEEAKKKSDESLRTAAKADSKVTYDVVYIDQETANNGGSDTYYSTDVIGYIKDGKEEQLSIAQSNSTPQDSNVTYKTHILTNPDDKATVTISKDGSKITVTVNRQPYQRYIQPDVSGTVTEKEVK